MKTPVVITVKAKIRSRRDSSNPPVLEVTYEP
jgi:hypothetical protein